MKVSEANRESSEANFYPFGGVSRCVLGRPQTKLSSFRAMHWYVSRSFWWCMQGFALSLILPTNPADQACYTAVMATPTCLGKARASHTFQSLSLAGLERIPVASWDACCVDFLVKNRGLFLVSESVRPYLSARVWDHISEQATSSEPLYTHQCTIKSRRSSLGLQRWYGESLAAVDGVSGLSTHDLLRACFVKQLAHLSGLRAGADVCSGSLLAWVPARLTHNQKYAGRLKQLVCLAACSLRLPARFLAWWKCFQEPDSCSLWT